MHALQKEAIPMNQNRPDVLCKLIFSISMPSVDMLKVLRFPEGGNASLITGFVSPETGIVNRRPTASSSANLSAASVRDRAAFSWLHRLHETTRFPMVVVPPLERGMTWSIVS